MTAALMERAPVPSAYEKHEGLDRMRLRDHGNEMVVGLALLRTLDTSRGGARAAAWRAPIARMLDRILLYAMRKTQGCFLEGGREGVKLGAVRHGERLLVSVEGPRGWTGHLHFDHARHRRDLNFDGNHVRLNEWPEWFTVDETRLDRLVDAAGRDEVHLGSELVAGIRVAASARWTVAPAQ